MVETVRERPWRAVVFLLATACLTAFGLGGSVLGDLFAPLIGVSEPGAEPGIGRDLLVALLLAGVLVANLEIIRLLPFSAQVGVVWVELLVLFFIFVRSFGRDFGVLFETSRSGISNLAFLITTGAFTTLYISLAAITIACILAMMGALAKLSRNGMAYAIATFYISFFRGTPLKKEM